MRARQGELGYWRYTGGMVALLAGARTTERAFAQGRGPDPATLCLGACGGFAGGFADEGDDVNPVR